MKGKLLGISAVVLVLALLLTLAPCCGKGEVAPGVTPTPGTPGVTPTPTPTAKTLKIGFFSPLSGPAARWGSEFELGAKWAADDINAAGGIKVGADTYMIKVISCDTKGVGSVAAECATRFVYEEGIRYVIGPLGAVEAVMPIFNEAKCFYTDLSPIFKGGPDKPYYINGNTSYPLYAAAFYENCVKAHPEVKTVAVIAPDTQDGHVNAGAAIAGATGAGLTLVSEEYYTGGITDFYPVLTKVLRTNPGAIDPGACGPGDQALMVKAARELGFTGNIFQPTYIPLDLQLNVIGLAFMYKISTAMPDFSSEFYSAAARELNRRYMVAKAKPGEDRMPDCVVHGYSHMMFYKKAIETAGSLDQDKVMKVIDDPNFTFERYYVSNAKLGGIETFGIRRQFPHYNPYSEVVIEGGQAKIVQKGGKAIIVP